MERNGRELSLFVKESTLKSSPHSKLKCVACHSGFNPEDIPHKDPILPVKCTSCHVNALLKHQFHIKMLQNMKAAKRLDEACKTCHGKHDVVSPKVKGSKFNGKNLVTACAGCHPAVVSKFNESAHGRALASDQKGAPSCIACHSNAITRTSEAQETVDLKRAQEKVCLSCHMDDPAVRAKMTTKKKFLTDYDKSVHGAALLSGNGKAANCVNCHGSHEMQKSLNPISQTNKTHIPDVCGNCHPQIAQEYKSSIHGTAVLKGNVEAPSCTNCHGEHNIMKAHDPKSPVAPANVSSRVCTPCHSSMKLSEKYGIAANRSQTFNLSYHGLAARGGSAEVANCASCHGIHNIKPSSDPASTVNKANLVKTCGKCHPGANERFTVGSIHVATQSKDEPLLYWVSTIYIILIIVIIGGMFIHNVADFRRKSIRKLMMRRGIIPYHQPAHRLYVRMTLNERTQHLTLLISFFLLVITGFMLRFPEAWWVVYIRQMSDSAFAARSILHRIAGIVMVAASLYHIGYLSVTDRGRKLFKDLLPKIQDAKDAAAVLSYNFGLSKEQPKFARFSYIEKSEYWALVWGNIVMAATGCIMWFDNYFMGILTKLGWDVARTIHYYEAWLAFLAILVWHIYFVIFNPDVYPMNLAWLKGSLTEEEMEDEHALELEEIKEREADVELPSPPSSQS